MFCQGEFEFMAGQPPRPRYRERLFLGIFPDTVPRMRSARFSGRFSTEIGLTGERLKALRLHTVADPCQRPQAPCAAADSFAAELAANASQHKAFRSDVQPHGQFSRHAQEGPAPSASARAARGRRTDLGSLQNARQRPAKISVPHPRGVPAASDAFLQRAIRADASDRSDHLSGHGICLGPQ